VSQKSIAGKHFIAQQPQHDFGDHDDEPKGEFDSENDAACIKSGEDSALSSQGLFIGGIGAGL
jgi:hypothetical protein